MLFSLPGTPVIRYGDEIGMGDDLSLHERNSVRTPMQWSADPQAGFSKAKKTVLPLIDKGPYAYTHVNVEAQRRDPDSLLNWMTSLIRLRKECPEIGWGDWEILATGYKEVLGICYSWRGNSLMTLHNFAEKPYEITLDLKQNKENKLIDLMRNEEIDIDESGKVRITLEAYGYKWFRTRNLSHLLNRTKQ
jgi:maltose alpha-D-glucosyltransferase/alpha-amylase